MKRLNGKLIVQRNNSFHLVVFSLIYFFYNEFLAEQFTSRNAGIIFVICIFALWLARVLFSGKIKVRLNMTWLLALAVMLYSSRTEIEKGKLYWSTIFVTLTFLLVVLPTDIGWVHSISGIFPKLGLVHVYATILFFIFSPGLYMNTMYLFWGNTPGGVSLSEAYRAGLSSHYSINGIYCAVMFIFYGSKMVAKGTFTPKEGVNLVACGLALLLTTKRAHLLFSLFAIITVYYFCAKGSRVNKFIKLAFAIVGGLIIFFCLAPIMPLFDAILDRFFGVTDISTGRFAYWEEAYALFKTEKLFGIGWGQYQYYNRYGTVVHNTYLQLLCETGIVGFLVFVIAMYSTYIKALVDYRKVKNKHTLSEKEMYVFAVAIQTYTLAYCLTGNCLYDISVIIYYIACALTLSFHSVQRKRF